ncbi:MAG TPA: signal recognition particle-docking protein FtsY [Cyanobacteria bacterium UBA8543]|nr:signal recognition particle-docking protein FtsY [Cyanobacteria bacterium UBA8543]
MVFNWFRRQFGTSEESSEETRPENPQVEQEQQANDKQESVETASSQSTQEQSAEVAEDYLLWAKAAYKNIQKQQVAVEPPESVEVDESTAQPTTEASPLSTQGTAVPETDAVTQSSTVAEEAEETIAPTDTQQLAEATATTPVESEEPATPETLEITQTPLSTSDVSEPQGETFTTQTTEAAPEEESASVEAAITEFEVKTTTQEEVATAPEPEAIPETPIEVASAQVQEKEEIVEPVLEQPAAVDSDRVAIANLQTSEPSSTEEAPSAPVPIWARQAARQERLERLKATAIEIPEPELVRAPVQPVEPAATTTIPAEEIPGLAFDEGFLWSAEVLAAQGRRPEDVSIEEISWLKRLRQGLSKTRRSLINQLRAIVGQGPLNQDAVMEIEALLLQADVGVEATDYIISTLQQRLREEVLPPEEAIAYLKTILRDLLDRPCQESYSPTFAPEKDALNIWLITGVNGAGKTTTIGKLAHLAQKSDYRCLIGAADTFRAAAVEQVKVWGERSGTEVIANPGKNTDPAAVVFDAIAAAQARNTELLLVDTAGRLQNKKNLMEELAKIRRIVDKKAPNAKVEALLVLDATLGQNGLRQAEVFSEAAKLSGVVLTKLDGTAKGGVALAVVQQLGLPIRFIGAGEGIEDLRPFSSYEFVEALLSG